jgi:hypothetical protein
MYNDAANRAVLGTHVTHVHSGYCQEVERARGFNTLRPDGGKDRLAHLG